MPRSRSTALCVIGLSLVVFALVVKLRESAADAKSSTHGAARLADPLTAPQMRSFLSTRSGSISIAVRDLRTGQEWLYEPGDRDQTASIIKVDILETLLRQAQRANAPLDDQTAAEVQGMIEASDDTDATELWNQVGASTGVGQYNASAGLTATDLNTEGYWGETTTSAADQIRLLEQLVGPGGELSRRSKRYELSLMEHIEPDQAWGVSAGVPSGVTVALKNGWVPLTSDTDWEINSVGYIDGDGRDYLIAALTAHDSSQGYGIDTIQGISRLVWAGLS